MDDTSLKRLLARKHIAVEAGIIQEEFDEPRVRTCPDCGRYLPRSHFFRGNTPVDGGGEPVSWYCKKCDVRHDREYRARLRDGTQELKPRMVTVRAMLEKKEAEKAEAEAVDGTA